MSSSRLGTATASTPVYAEYEDGRVKRVIIEFMADDEGRITIEDLTGLEDDE